MLRPSLNSISYTLPWPGTPQTSLSTIMDPRPPRYESDTLFRNTGPYERLRAAMSVALQPSPSPSPSAPDWGPVPAVNGPDVSLYLSLCSPP